MRVRQALTSLGAVSDKCFFAHVEKFYLNGWIGHIPVRRYFEAKRQVKNRQTVGTIGGEALPGVQGSLRLQSCGLAKAISASKYPVGGILRQHSCTYDLTWRSGINLRIPGERSSSRSKSRTRCGCPFMGIHTFFQVSERH